MVKIVRVCRKCNDVFTTVNKDQKNCSACKPRNVRGPAVPVEKIDEKWLVRGNISNNNRNCSITCGEA